MWNYLKRRRALRSYRTKLARKLKDRYGRERYYSTNQVKTAAADSGVSSVFLCYAFAMFCERDVFEAHHRETGESCDYVAMRAEAGAAAGLADTFDATAFHFEDSTPWVGDLGGFDGGGFDGGCGGD